MPQSWTVLARRYLLRRPWLNLREDHVRLPSGEEMAEFHLVEVPNWACVLCTTVEQEVVLVEQYRHGIERVTLELPAGVVEANESPVQAAQRELLEETGYVAETWTLLGTCAPDPSKHTNKAYLFVASDARRVRAQRLDASEAIHLRRLTPEALLARADRGEVEHGIHLTVLFWAVHRGWPGTLRTPTTGAW